MPRRCVILGNCQAAMLEAVLRASALAADHDFVTLTDFVATRASFADAVTGADLILLQVPLAPYAEYPWFVANLPARVPTLRFPLLWFGSLWPYWRWELACPAEPPLYPFGRFPYGDAFIHGLARPGADAEAIAATYLAHDAYGAGEARARFNADVAALRAVEAGCAVTIADWLLARLQHRAMFDTPNHPHRRVMHAIADQILARLDRPALPQDDRLPPVQALQVPLHPSVVQGFGLRHAGPGTRYLTDPAVARPESAAAYYRRYAAWCVQTAAS